MPARQVTREYVNEQGETITITATAVPTGEVLEWQFAMAAPNATPKSMSDATMRFVKKCCPDVQGAEDDYGLFQKMQEAAFEATRVTSNMTGEQKLEEAVKN